MLYDTVFLPKPCVCCDFHLKLLRNCYVLKVILLWNCYSGEIVVQKLPWWNSCENVTPLKLLWKWYLGKTIMRKFPWWMQRSNLNSAAAASCVCCHNLHQFVSQEYYFSLHQHISYVPNIYVIPYTLLSLRHEVPFRLWVGLYNSIL